VRRNHHGLAAFKVFSLLGWVCVMCPSVEAQKAPPAAGTDPFIAAIEAIKPSVGSMDCLEVRSTKAKVLKRIGSAFLISDSGDFLTAAHVLAAMQQKGDPCPKSAITVPVDGWRPEAPTEDMVWFPFKNSDCNIDTGNDVSECRLSGDLPARIRKLHLKSVQLGWGIPPDGIQIAFTGFPLEARDPMTFLAHVAAYRGPSPGKRPTRGCALALGDDRRTRSDPRFHEKHAAAS
jgi:hypothetical protein